MAVVKLLRSLEPGERWDEAGSRGSTRSAGFPSAQLPHGWFSGSLSVWACLLRVLCSAESFPPGTGRSFRPSAQPKSRAGGISAAGLF